MPNDFIGLLMIKVLGHVDTANTKEVNIPKQITQ
jgi:hypothetical protein